MRVERTVRSRRTPDEAWSLVGDFRRLASWDPGVARVVARFEGTPQVGDRYVVWVRVGPWSLPMDYVVQLVEGRRIVLEGRTWWFRAVDDVAVVADGGGSVVVWRATLGPAGPLAVTAPLWGPGLRRVADAAMDGLAKALA